MEFEKWLKKNIRTPAEIWDEVPSIDTTELADLPSHVEVRALGEHFLEQHIDFQVISNTTKEKRNIKAYKAISQVFKSMAEKCLGKAEVEKKLKEMR